MQHLNDFIHFVRTQGVMGLAIGFILGGSVQKVVTALITDIISPLLGVILGGAAGFKEAVFWLGPAKIMYGDFLLVLLDFLIIAAVVFFVFRGLGLDRLDKKKE